MFTANSRTAGDSGADVLGSGSTSVTIQGTLAQINALLGAGGSSTVLYTDTSDTPSASVALALSINDRGNTGTGGAQTATATSSIQVAPVDDARRAPM